MSQRMSRAATAVGVPESPLRFFHLGTHGMQVVSRRDYGEEQNEGAAESDAKNERVAFLVLYAAVWTRRSGPSPPQQKGRQQQRKPAKIKKQLHTKRAQF